MNFKTTLVILLVFIIFGGAYLMFFQDKPDDESDTSQPKIGTAYELEKDEIRRMRISFSDAAYAPLSLTKDVDGAWQLTEPVVADAQGAKINEMLGDLLNKKIKRTLEVTTLAEYELAPPKIQIQLWTTGETPDKTFLIGTKTVNYSVYAKEASEPHIFLIESSALEDFTKSASDVRDRSVLKFDLHEVTALTLRVTGKSEIRCQKREANLWKMDKPIETEADSKEIKSILSALDTLKVVAFEGDGVADLTAYGLDTPRSQARLDLADGSVQQLLIGGDDNATGRIYTKRADFDSVYAVNREIYTKLNKTVFDLRSKRVIDFQRTATTRFEIERQGREKIVCEKNSHGDWEIKAPVVLKADASAVDDLLFGVDSLKAVEFVADSPKSLQPYGLDAPSIKVSFTATDTDTVVLHIGKMKGETVYVKSQRAEPVFGVKKNLINLVGMGVAELRDKQILDFDSDSAVKLTLRHGDANLTCQKQGTNWRLTHPVQEDAKNGTVNSILYQIDQLKVERFLADTPDVARTGFDALAIQVAVTLKDGTEHVLQIGKSAGSEHLYARLWRSPNTIFLLKADIVETLKQTVEDFRAMPDGA
jgi:hypothetical protein